MGDIEVVTMFAIDALTISTSAAQQLTHKYDLKQRKGALHAVRAWAAKGYQPVYLSGRQVRATTALPQLCISEAVTVLTARAQAAENKTKRTYGKKMSMCLTMRAGLVLQPDARVAGAAPLPARSHPSYQDPPADAAHLLLGRQLQGGLHGVPEGSGLGYLCRLWQYHY